MCRICPIHPFVKQQNCNCTSKEWELQKNVRCSTIEPMAEEDKLDCIYFNTGLLPPERLVLR